MTALGPTSTPRPSILRIYLQETRFELLKTLRLPAYAIPTLAFPTLFYVMFSTAYGAQSIGSVGLATYMLATYGTFGVIGAALFGFGVGVAIERGQGWLLLKRASPMPVGAYFAAKVAMAVLFSALIVIAISILGALLNGIRLPAGTWLALGGTLVAGALPFCALGLAFGTWCGPNSAPAIVNLFYLPMSFGSGLWVPIETLPAFVRDLAPFMPPYHVAQLALKTVGVERGTPISQHVGALVILTAISLAVAAVGYKRDEGKTYG